MSAKNKKPVGRVHKWASLVHTQYKNSISAYLGRRPHRSFQRTRRRDYARSLELPGYISFSAYVVRTLYAHKKLFVGLALFYAVLGGLLVGVASQETYSQLTELLDETGANIFSGGWGAIGQATTLFIATASGGITPSLTEAQQIYSGIILLLTWLATVWALRAILAGSVPSLRAVLYNSGAPIIGTGLVMLAALFQLLPIALAIVVVNAAIATGMFDSPTMSMLISLAAGGLSLLSVYWITSTIMALVVVTLPGMYPWQAIRTAGDLVIGRRLRILLRLLWMMLVSAVVVTAIVLPVILVDRAVTSVWGWFELVPLVPFTVMAVSSLTVIWSASYVYLLYRKVVEDDASPA